MPSQTHAHANAGSKLASTSVALCGGQVSCCLPNVACYWPHGAWWSSLQTAFSLTTQSNFPGAVAEMTPTRLLPINPTQWEERKRGEGRSKDISAMGNSMLQEGDCEPGEGRFPQTVVSCQNNRPRWEFNKGCIFCGNFIPACLEIGYVLGFTRSSSTGFIMSSIVNKISAYAHSSGSLCVISFLNELLAYFVFCH